MKRALCVRRPVVRLPSAVIWKAKRGAFKPLYSIEHSMLRILIRSRVRNILTRENGGLYFSRPALWKKTDTSQRCEAKGKWPADSETDRGARQNGGMVGGEGVRPRFTIKRLVQNLSPKENPKKSKSKIKCPIRDGTVQILPSSP